MVMGFSREHHPSPQNLGSGRDVGGRPLTAGEETKVCIGEGAVRRLSGHQGSSCVVPWKAQRRL